MCETVLIEVKIPALQQFYDFRISRKMAVATVIQYIVGCIMQIGGNKTWEAQKDVLCLCSTDGVLNNNKTLADYGVHSGDMLILV